MLIAVTIQVGLLSQLECLRWNLRSSKKEKKTHENWEFLFEIMESTFIFQLSNSAGNINNPANYISYADLSMKSQTAEHSLKSRSELCSKLSIKHAQDISHLPFVCSISR
jgi:hypothetical protein